MGYERESQPQFWNIIPSRAIIADLAQTSLKLHTGFSIDLDLPFSLKFP